MAEMTDIQKGQADYLAACAEYDAKTQIETRKMNQAQKLAHARACSELYGKKRAAKVAVDNLLKNKK